MLAGLGLPAMLYGLVVAVLLFFLTYPRQWNVAGAADCVVETVTTYGVGAMLYSAAAGGALDAHLQNEHVTEFIWGSTPEGYRSDTSVTGGAARPPIGLR